MDQAPCPLQASEGWRPEAWLVAVQRRELCQLSSWHGEAEQGVGMDPDPEEGGDGELVWDELGEKEIQATAIQPCLFWIRKEEVMEDCPGRLGRLRDTECGISCIQGSQAGPKSCSSRRRRKKKSRVGGHGSASPASAALRGSVSL
jgi:hypothetical protein